MEEDVICPLPLKKFGKILLKFLKIIFMFMKRLKLVQNFAIIHAHRIL